MQGTTFSLPYNWCVSINWHNKNILIKALGYRYDKSNEDSYPIRSILLLGMEISWSKKIEFPIYPGMTSYDKSHPDYPDSPRDWDRHKVCKRRSGAIALGLSWKHHPVRHHRHKHDIVAYFSKTKIPEQENHDV